MGFTEATDRLTDFPTHHDIARKVGAKSVQGVRQARLSPSSPSFRRPPAGWESAIAKLARERAAELVKLAEELEG